MHSYIRLVNYLDLILALPILWGAYKGFTKGLIVELASLIGLLLGLYIGVNFSDFSASILSTHTNIDPKMLPIAAFSLTFLGVIIGVFIVAKIIEKVVNLIALKMLNKLAGACFGILKSALIFSALLFVFDTVDKQLHLLPNEQKESSLLYPIIQPIAPKIAPQLKDFDVMEKVDIPLPEINI